MTILATEAEQNLITVKALSAISNKKDDFSDFFTITVSFAHKVTQVPRTPKSITNIIKQGNEPIQSSTIIISTLQIISTSKAMNNIIAQTNEDAEPPASAQYHTGQAQQSTKQLAEAAVTASVYRKQIKKT